MKYLRSVWPVLFGDLDRISSDKYLVTITCFFAAIYLIFLSFIHIIMGLKIAPVIIASSSALLLLVLYYFLRFKQCVFIPKLTLTIIGLIALDLSWYSKFLSNGPVLFFILIFAALVIWVWEGKWLAIVLSFYFLNLAVLGIIEHYSPEHLFEYTIPGRRGLDIYFSFFLYASLMIFLLYIVKQEFVRQKEKAIKSDKLKSAFLANMSHEIRTPMNSILGFADLLKQGELHLKEQQEFLSIIHKSGERMLNIINDIIDISKIEAGLMELNVGKTNINEQLEFVYALFKPEADAKGVSLSFRNTLYGNKSIIEADTEKLYAVLVNLVKNSIKFTSKGHIEIGYNLTSSKEHPNMLTFYVKDTGIGIPKSEQEAVFERFIQADIANGKCNIGTGLGLSISKAYIELMGGSIWVESQEDFGSTFFFTLPYNPIRIKDIDIPKNIREEDDEAEISGLKIIVAEDDEQSEMLLNYILNGAKNKVIRVKNGIDAVEKCKNTPDIDLILMDIQMPKMNGYEATKAIRAFNKDVVIIAQTAFGLSGDRETAIEAGCNDYISKPINRTELIALIRKNLNKD